MKIAAHFLSLTMVIQEIGTYLVHTTYKVKNMLCTLVGTINILRQQFFEFFGPTNPLCQQKYSTERQQKLSFSDLTHLVHMLT